MPSHPAKPSRGLQPPGLTLGDPHPGLTPGDPHPSPPLRLHFVPVSAISMLSCAALLHASLLQISLRSRSLATLICHSFIISQARDTQIRFPLSVWIIVIPFYGLDASFLVLCFMGCCLLLFAYLEVNLSEAGVLAAASLRSACSRALCQCLINHLSFRQRIMRLHTCPF